MTVDALLANLRVDNVWKKLILAGDTVQIIEVSEFPPRAFCRILVSFESLYGICYFVLEESFEITLDRMNSDLFI